MMNTLPTPAYNCQLSTEHLALIGRISHSWSLNEMLCLRTLEKLLALRADETKQVLSFSSMEGLADLLKKVANNRIADPDIKSLALACVPELKRLSKERAVIIHGMWATNTDFGSVKAFLLKNIKRAISDSELERIYSETANLSNAMAHVWWETSDYDAPSPWLDKWHQGNHPCPQWPPCLQEGPPKS